MKSVRATLRKKLHNIYVQYVDLFTFFPAQSKQSLTNEEAVTNDVVAQAHLESKGVQLFVWADTKDRAGQSNKYVIIM